VSKPRGGNRPSRSVDMSSRALAEYREAERRRQEWATEHALREQLEGVGQARGWTVTETKEEP
jgi:hypothetical protein